jgi:hypothetical protein
VEPDREALIGAATADTLPDVPDRRWILPVAAAVVQRPTLWGSGLRAALRLAPRGWWRAWPPIPVPPSAYLRFRVQTNDGSPDARPRPDEVVAFLRWCRDNRHVVGSPRRLPLGRSMLRTSE